MVSGLRGNLERCMVWRTSEESISGSREWSTPQNAPERYGNGRGVVGGVYV